MTLKEEIEKASFEENQKFIKKILKLATHNAFTKDDLLLLIKWQNVIIEKMKNHNNCKWFHEWNLSDIMDEPLDDLSPCQGCKKFSLWEPAE